MAVVRSSFDGGTWVHVAKVPIGPEGGMHMRVMVARKILLIACLGGWVSRAYAASACADWTHITHASGTFVLSGNASGTMETAPYTKLQYEIHQSVTATLSVGGSSGTTLAPVPGSYKKKVSISVQYATTYNPPGGNGYTTTVSYQGSTTQGEPYLAAELQIDLETCQFSLLDTSPYITVTETDDSGNTSPYPYFWGPEKLPSGDVSSGPPQRSQPLAGAHLQSSMSFAAPDVTSSDYGVDVQWTSTLDLSGQGGDLGPQTGGASIPAPHTSDSSFIAESTNKSCQYSDQSPIRLSIPITRVVGDVDQEGFLTDPDKLVSNGVVSPNVTLRISAYDVDSQAPVEPELDYVTVNGAGFNQLRGRNDEWVVNEFQIPVDAVRFGRRNPKSDPTPGMNDVEISIDLISRALKPLQLWCMGVDWAQLEFKALSPVIMVNGNNSDHEFWEKFDFIKPFQDQGIPFDHLVDLPTAPVESNAAELATILTQKAREFGAKWVHVVAHSKGGLDMRQMLTNNMPEDFGIRSLTTLSTPHHGSALADFGVYAPQASLLFTDLNFRYLAGLYAAIFLPDEGRPYLTTAAVSAFNSWNAGLLPPFFLVDDEIQNPAYNSFSADANIDGSTDADGQPTIQDFENMGTDERTWVAQLAYRTLWNYASASLVPKSNIFVTQLVLEGKLNDEPQPNDFLVTVKSAELNPPFTELFSSKNNHATIADTKIAVKVIDGIRAAQPVK
jgi:hypothetical protein